MNPFSFRYKIAGVFILALVVVVSCKHGDDSTSGTGPKDQELLTDFHEHREAFEKIQQMATNDAQRELYLDAHDFQESKFDAVRQQEYKRLISEIRPGLDVTIDGHDNVVISTHGNLLAPHSVTNFETTTLKFLFAGEGSAIGSDWAKGIEFVPGNYKRQGVILTNLDEAHTLPANVYLRPVETNWFLFYQRTD